MLKVTIAKLEDVAEKFRQFYSEQADGTFLLDEDLHPEDTTGLKNNNAALKEEKRLLKEKMDALQAKMDADEEGDLAAKEEYEKLMELKTKQFDAKFDSANLRAEAAEAALKTQMINATVAEVAATLAGENSTLIMPHLKNRFNVDLVEGQPRLQILDKDGTPGVITKEQLIEEFKTNKMFAPILKGRDSSGGGSGGGAGTGGQADSATWDSFFNPAGDSYDSRKQDELKEKDSKLHATLVKKYKLDDPYSV